MDRMENTANNLKKHGFQVQVLDTAAQAKEAALALIGTGSVGFGGSVTVRDMSLYETLQEQGNAVYWHWKAKPEEGPSVLAAAHTADVYVCSSNAVLESGALLNIDGTGNRVASMFYGPKRVVIIAGQNKIASDYADALARIKREACPPNARRLNFKTPCAITGECNDCSSAQRMCNVTALLERPSFAVKDVHVLLVRESLGY
jgi:L-lactate utilization protein LutC